MAENTTTVENIQIGGIQEATNQFNQLGASGAKAFEQIGTASTAASTAIDKSAASASTAMKTAQDSAQKLGGTLRDVSTQARNLDFGGLAKSFSNLGNNLAEVTGGLSGVARALGIMGAAAGVAGAAIVGITLGVGKLVKNAADATDALRDAANQAGTTADTIQKLGFAGEQSGTSFNKVTRALGLLNNPSKNARAELEKLRITMNNTDGTLRDSGDLFLEIADKISQIENPTERAGAAARIFGRRLGPELNELLSQGRKGIEALGKEAEKLGLIFTPQQLEAGDNFNDSLARLQRTVSTLFNKFLIGLAPAFTRLFDKLADSIAKLIPYAEKLGEELGKAFENFANSTAVGIFIQSINIAGRAVALFFRALVAGKEATDGVSKGIGTFVTSLNNLIATGITTIWDTFVNGARNAFNFISTAANLLWQTIVSIFQAGVNALLPLWTTITTIATTVWNNITLQVQAMWAGITLAFNTGLAFLTAVWAAITASGQAVWAAISTAVAAAVQFIQDTWTVLVEFFTNLWTAITETAIEAWNSLVEFMQPVVQAIMDLWNSLVGFFQGLWDSITSLFASAWDSIVNAAQAGFNAIIEFTRPVIAAIQEVIKWVQAAADALAALGGASTGGAVGEAASGFARGGRVRGPGTSTSDSILAWLSDREFVIRSKAVDYYGPQLFHALNSMRLPKGGLPGFATGGQAMASALSKIPAFVSGGWTWQARDPGFGLGAFMQSAEDVIKGMNVPQFNAQTVKNVNGYIVDSQGNVGPQFGRPIYLQIGNETFEFLSSDEENAQRLIRYANQRAMRRAGKKPSYYGKK